MTARPSLSRPARFPLFSLLALAAGLFAAPGTANAQASPYPLPSPPAGAANGPQDGAAKPHPQGRMRAALAQLDLTPAQKSQVVSAFKSFRAARGTATPMTLPQLRTNIEAVLTPGQLAQFKTLMRRHPGAPVAGASPSPT